MDFLDSLALPQSQEHLVLLKYLLGLTFTLFVPYLAVLIGADFFALLLKERGLKKEDSKYIKLARDVINIVTPNLGVVFALGIIPLLSATFCYTQLLQQSSSAVSVYMFLTLLVFIAAIIVLYTFRNGFNLYELFIYFERKNYEIDDSEIKDYYDRYKGKSQKLYQKSGIWSLLLLILTALFFVATVELAAHSERWTDSFAFLKVMLTVSTFSYLGYIISAAVTITSATVLLYYYRINKDSLKNEEYISFVRNFTLTSGLIAAIAQPLFLAINLIFTPKGALSSSAFVVVLLMLTALLIICTLFYVMMKDRRTNFVVPILILSLAVFVFSNVEDQLAFGTASKKQFAELEVKFQKYEEEFKAGLGIEAVAISGEDIYNGKCIACHRFDRKVTGPPYNSVLPKYIGKKGELVQFILNPVKKNPDYPAMPNQGLKPKEADAVADFLLSTYKEEHQ